MDKIENMNDIFYDGSLINLKSTSIENLETKLEEINAKQKNIKAAIYEIIESF